ncbi:PAS and helix-turn-helix domain-containing protein [Pseudooceanicola sp. CBS1P-1]|uniref:PAS domain-containing protein n=1 Tax=Pseudooceanicola albus TaxID=2692189 RepID=A0A6L7G799_9RHOB|nr:MULTISPECIES: PAS and helix-turn-helix domain-containing protein [Pseudooceanicola]MBT9384081.1 PAS and helix-turn-helix domain-containing protein [Pseudooceanicola endophyticus]MXN19819.1 PAS domain-containing protein [Pseudooceanicola albus]
MDESTFLAWDHAPQGLVLAEDRIIRACNRTFAELVGHAPNHLIGQSFRVLYASDAEFDTIRDIGLSALRDTGFYSDERMMQRAGGSPFWVRFRARTLTPEAPLARLVMSFAPLSRTTENPMTPRERDVVQGLARGQTSKEIARTLALSPRTVEDVRARLLRKHEVRNAAELIRKLAGPGL